jgi:hypothetical protein
MFIPFLYIKKIATVVTLTWNASIMDGVSYACTVNLRATGAYTEFSPIKPLLIYKMSSSPIYSVA